MILQNISKFSNTSDYLPIITGALIVDMVILFRMVLRFINIRSLETWYNKFGLLAVVADVLSIVIGIIMSRFLYSLLFKEYSLITFLLLTCAVQFTHDISFAWFFNSIPRNNSIILDVFKDYAREVGVQILFVDALMMISTILFGSYLATYSINTQIIIFIVSLYILPYLLYSIRK